MILGLSALNAKRRKQMLTKNRTFVVMGLGRCGTSAVAGLLDTLGISMLGEGTDRTKAMDRSFSNPKGQFEDVKFQNTNVGILRQAGAPEWWYDIPDPDKILQVGKDPTYVEHVTSLIERHNENNKVWGFKDPRLSATYPVIRPYLTNPHVILCGRTAKQTVSSMTRVFSKVSYMQKMGPPPNPYMFYATVLSRCLNYLFSLSDPLMIVSFERMMKQPESIAKEVSNFAGVKCTEEALDWIDPGLQTIMEDDRNET